MDESGEEEEEERNGMEMVFRKDRVGYLAGRTIIDPEEGDAAGGGGGAREESPDLPCRVLRHATRKYDLRGCKPINSERFDGSTG